MLAVVYTLPQIAQPLQLLVRLPAVSIECRPLFHIIHNDLLQSWSVSLVPLTKSEENVSVLARNPLKKPLVVPSQLSSIVFSLSEHTLMHFHNSVYSTYFSVFRDFYHFFTNKISK